MVYPNMDPSLDNFVETMAPKNYYMQYNDTPQDFRESMKKKVAMTALKRPSTLDVRAVSYTHLTLPTIYSV